MKKLDSHAMIHGIINGLVCAIYIFALSIISIYTDFSSLLFYLSGLPLTITSYILLKQPRVKYFFIAWGMDFLVFRFILLLLYKTNTINVLYSHIYPEYENMAHVGGLMVLAISASSILWTVPGTIGALIRSIKNGNKFSNLTHQKGK